jgi:hypothetical protein
MGQLRREVLFWSWMGLRLAMTYGWERGALAALSAKREYGFLEAIKGWEGLFPLLILAQSNSDSDSDSGSSAGLSV